MKLTSIHVGIILLAAATAVIHIALAVPQGMAMLMFYLNGAGYLVLTAVYFLPQFSRWKGLTRWALIGFTAVTIIGWVVIGSRTTIAYIDKLIEVGLIALLWIDGHRE